MQKPQTPTIDKLNAMPPGVARDVFHQTNQRAIQAETSQQQAFEAAGETSKADARVELARKAGCPELARYRELEQSHPLMATIYRESNAFVLAQQQRAIAPLETPPDSGPPEAA